MATKVCTKCGEEKDIEEFGNRTSAKDGKRGKCKKCKQKEDSEYHSKNKEYRNFIRSVWNFNQSYMDGFEINKENKKILKQIEKEKKGKIIEEKKSPINIEKRKKEVLKRKKEREYNKEYYYRKKAEKNKQNNA